MNQSQHEESLINSFVCSSKRARLLTLVSNPKKREKALNALYHFHDLDDRFVVPISSGDQSPKGIADILRSFGAPDTCWVMSTNDSLDSHQMLLDEAMVAIVGQGEGSFISCVPGKLAFFEGEEPKDRCILHRATKP